MLSPDLCKHLLMLNETSEIRSGGAYRELAIGSTRGLTGSTPCRHVWAGDFGGCRRG